MSKTESGGSRSGMPAQASHPSVGESRELERPHEPDVPVSNQDTQEDFPQVPWNDIMTELRSVSKQTCRQLRTQVEGITSSVDTSHIVRSQEALPRRNSMIEDGVQYGRSLRMQEREHTTETHREYQAKVDLCLARIGRLTNRMRAHWYHDLSEQEF